MLDKNIIYNSKEKFIKKIDNMDNIDYIFVNNPYNEMDEICAKLNRVKYSLLEKASIAHMGCVVESSEERPIIGTQALDTCYGILFYDRAAKKGIVGHGFPSGKVGTLCEMIRRIDDGTNKVVEYVIIPGFRNTDRKDLTGITELQMVLEKMCPKNIKFIYLKSDLQVKLDEPTLSYEFAFDTRNGKSVSESLFFDEEEVNPRYISHSKGRYGK